MLARASTSAIGGVSPGVLFQQDGVGCWFDPQDLRTLYQDSAGTTPVTGVEQPVGLMLDKSRGLALGPELATNGTFDSAAGWSFTPSPDWSVAGGALNSSGVVGTRAVTTLGNSFVSGRAYLVRFSTTLAAGQSLGFVLAQTAAIDITVTSANVVNGFVSFVFNAGLARPVTTGTYCALRDAGHALSVDNLSIRELQGYHATQITAASRPTLSARHNMLVGTNTYTGGTATTLATDYTLSFSGTGTITLSGTATGTKSSGTNTFTTTAGTLTLTVSGTVNNAQLVASNLSSIPYQSVTSSTVYDADPTKFPWYLQMSDHWLSTPPIDATTYDEVAVFAALRKGSDAARGTVIESSATIASNNGAFALSAPYAASATVGFESKGTTLREATVSSLTSPVTQVLVGLGNISGDSSVIRNNGVASGANSSDQGTGNYGNYAVYIGKRGGASSPFVGRFYGATVRFGTALPNDNVIVAIEKYYAVKAGLKINV